MYVRPAPTTDRPTAGATPVKKQVVHIPQRDISPLYSFRFFWPPWKCGYSQRSRSGSFFSNTFRVRLRRRRCFLREDLAFSTSISLQLGSKHRRQKGREMREQEAFSPVQLPFGGNRTVCGPCFLVACHLSSRE